MENKIKNISNNEKGFLYILAGCCLGIGIAIFTGVMIIAMATGMSGEESSKASIIWEESEKDETKDPPVTIIHSISGTILDDSLAHESKYGKQAMYGVYNDSMAGNDYLKVIWYGPYANLPSGNYNVTFRMRGHGTVRFDYCWTTSPGPGILPDFTLEDKISATIESDSYKDFVPFKNLRLGPSTPNVEFRTFIDAGEVYIDYVKLEKIN